MSLKVAIVGTAPTSRDQAPFSDPSWEIWGQAQPDLPRWTRWFELHDLGMIERDYSELWGWLAKRDGSQPVYLAKADPRIQGSVAFPRDEIVKRFGPYFLTSTVAWEMALAICEGATDIALYGIEMSAESEYAAQKPGCQHFITLARHHGINVTIPAGCELLSPQPLYALGEVNPQAKNIAAKRAVLIKERDQLASEMEAADRKLHKYQGAIEALEFFEQNWP